ncbi:MAG: DinB family protein [Chitinophagaceae bacterium]
MTEAIQLLEEMNDYNARVNADFVQHLIKEQPSSERIATLMSHIVSAHQIWLERMSGKSMSVKVFETRSYSELLEQIESNRRITSEILRDRSLSDSITYVNTKRQRFSNTIKEMFLHLFNHSSYHRGQINQLLVAEGKQAMVSDYIVYNRTELFD